MSLLGKALQPRVAAAVNPPGGVDEQLRSLVIDGRRTQSGERVTAESALALDAFWAGVGLLADTIGALPFKSYRKAPVGDRGRSEISTRVARLLRATPNPDMTAIDLWSFVVVSLLTWGNAYVGKRRDSTGAVEAFWPIDPSSVQVGRRRGRKIFVIRDAGRDLGPFTSDEIVHVMGLSVDGLIGLSPVQVHRETIGKVAAQERFGNRFFENSAVPSGVLTVPESLDDDGFKRVRRDWNRVMRGASNAHSIAVLEQGTRFEAISMPLDDAQYIEQKKFSVQEIARILRVPPSMIGGSSGDSLKYSTVEGDAIHFERYSLNGWLVRIEQAFGNDADLYSPRTYPEFFRDAILRSDSKTRAEVYTAALNPETGWMSRAEVRDAENLSPEREDVAGRVQSDMAALLASAQITDGRKPNGTPVG